MEAVICDVPFIYNALVVPPRKRIGKSSHLIGTVPVRVQLADDETLPIAFRIRPVGPEGLSSGPEIIRWDGVHHYSRVTGDYSKDSPAAILGDLATSPAASIQVQQKWSLGGALPEKEAAGRIAENKRAERQAEVIGAVSGMIFCSGAFWSITPEPVWKAFAETDETTGDIILSVHIVSATPKMQANAFRDSFYRADKLKDLIENVSSVVGGRHNVRVRNELEILIPEAVTLDDAGLAVLAAAFEMLEEAAANLRERPMSFLMAFAALRDHLRSAAKVNDDLESAISALLGMMDPPGENNHRSTGQDCMRSALQRYRQGRAAPHSETQCTP